MSSIPALPERWVPVPGHEGVYEISSIGRVRSLERLNSRGYRQPAKLMKSPIDSTGYRVLNLTRNGVPVKNRVHVLVCTAFNGDKPDIPHAQVRHLDGDQLNNCSDNLTWGTYKDQRQDDLRNGVHWRARMTHCSQGHEFTSENTYSPPCRPSMRTCRRCQKTNSRARYQRLRSAGSPRSPGGGSHRGEHDQGVRPVRHRPLHHP